MKYYLVIVCFFCMVHVAFADNLLKNPPWKKIETLASAIYVGDCEVRNISDQIIEITAYVYTIDNSSKNPIDRYRVCQYDKDFICGKNISILKFNQNKCNKPYKIFIYSKTDSIEVNAIFKSNLNYTIYPKNGTEICFYPDNLKTLTLGTYTSDSPVGPNQKSKIDYLCDAYFDSNGFAYLEYNTSRLCDESPKKPKFPGESNPSPKKIATSSPTKPTKKVKIGRDIFIYHPIYGYVLHNKYFNINGKNFNDAQLTAVSFVKKNKNMDFSPVFVDKNKTLWFNLTVSADFLFLFKNNTPEFIYKKAYMLSIDSIDRGYKVEKLNKYIVLKSKETYNLLKQHIVLKQELYLIDNALSTLKNAKEYYSKLQIPIENKILKSFTYDENFKWYKIENKTGNYAIIDREYYLEKINNQWNIKSKATNFSNIVNIPKISKEKKFKIEENNNGKKYFQTPIWGHEYEYIYEIIEPKTNTPFSKGKQFSG